MYDDIPIFSDGDWPGDYPVPCLIIPLNITAYGSKNVKTADARFGTKTGVDTGQHLVNICGSSIKGSTPSPLFIRGEQSDSWDAMSSGRISAMKPSQNEFLLMATSDETKPWLMN